MRLRLRLRPPVTTSTCSDCGQVVRERVRQPCPGCGSTARIVGRSLTDTVAARDRL